MNDNVFCDNDMLSHLYQMRMFLLRKNQQKDVTRPPLCQHFKSILFCTMITNIETSLVQTMLVDK